MWPFRPKPSPSGPIYTQLPQVVQAPPPELPGAENDELTPFDTQVLTLVDLQGGNVPVSPRYMIVPNIGTFQVVHHAQDRMQLRDAEQVSVRTRLLSPRGQKELRKRHIEILSSAMPEEDRQQDGAAQAQPSLTPASAAGAFLQGAQKQMNSLYAGQAQALNNMANAFGRGGPDPQPITHLYSKAIPDLIKLGARVEDINTLVQCHVHQRQPPKDVFERVVAVADNML